MGNTNINLSTNNLIDQVESVRFDLNMNPLGIPESVTNAIRNNISELMSYPDSSYKRLKQAISTYCNAKEDDLIIGGSSYEFIKLFIEFNSPKKAMIITPGAQNYEKLLKMNGCEIINYKTSEEDDFILDVADLISHLNEDIDMLFISNPNGTTSSIVDRENLEYIAKICQGNDVFLVVDEEYMEFAEENDLCTAIPLVDTYDNMVVLRNTTKFFAVPGLRLSYALTSNAIFKKTLEITGFPYPINKLAEAAGLCIFGDNSYINQTATLMKTERNLVYSALISRKTIKLFKPSANFILIKLLKDDVYSRDVKEYCIHKGLYIRDCSDIDGLGSKFIRISFMNPSQNDLLVNTILEIV